MVLRVEQPVFLAPGVYGVAETTLEVTPEMLRIIIILLRHYKG